MIHLVGSVVVTCEQRVVAKLIETFFPIYMNMSGEN